MLSWLHPSTPSLARMRWPRKIRPRLEALEDRTLLAVDPTFGSGGLATTSVGAGTNFAHRVVAQPDGKILVAGAGFNESNIGMVRYNPDGSLDAAFGNGGIVSTGPGPYSFLVRGLTLQPDGKILVGGARGPTFLFRFNADGSLDTSFSSPLRFTTQSDENAVGPFLQPDGKILMVETSSVLRVGRVNADGSLDTTFGQGGIAVFSSITGVHALSAGVQSDGKVVVVGQSGFPLDKDVFVARLTPDGRLDDTFGTAGVVRTDFQGGEDGGTGVFPQADGTLVVTGFATVDNHGQFAVLHYHVNGTLDTTFGNGGKVTTTHLIGAWAVQQPDGKIVAATANDRTIGLVRFNVDGTLDLSFGPLGAQVSQFPERFLDSGVTFPADVAVQADGKIVVSATVFRDSQNYDFAVARFLANDAHTPHQRYVTQLYLDLLGRPVDDQGLSYWSSLLDHGSSRLDVTRAIQASFEYQVKVVQDAYRRLLRRDGDSGGLITWVQLLQQGGTTERLEAYFVGSAEYLSNLGGGTTDGYLQAVYLDLLGRPLDSSGQQTWTQFLAQGQPRDQVAVAILHSDEGAAKEVRDLYFRLLRRQADNVGLQAFSPNLSSRDGRAEVIADLAGSDEYFSRV